MKDAGYIRCPHCGKDEDAMVHPTAVRINRGGEITLVDSNGTHMQAGTTTHRGVSIENLFVCEQGHQFVMQMVFHKGSVYVEYKDVPDELTKIRETIWRD